MTSPARQPTMQRFDLATAPLDAGTVLLEASAGTGKTYTLVGLLLRQLLEKKIERLDQALVVTFTVAATEELKNRLRRALGDVVAATRQPARDPFFQKLAGLPDAARIARAALDRFDEVSIATIHGFCKRLLDEAAFESREPFQLDFAADSLPLLFRAAADALRALYTPGPSVQSALLHENEISPEQLVTWYRLWRRYPDVKVLPEAPDPARHLADLEEALAAAARLADETILRELAGYAWYANKSPFPEPADAFVPVLLARIRQTPALALPHLRAFAATSLVELVQQHARPDPGRPFFVACERVRTAHDEALAHVRAAVLQRMHERLEADKRRTHVLSFDDLLARTYAALHDPERAEPLLAAIRARHEIALIDEFQDTDALQYGIFAKCFARRPLFLIGDPKQSIYGFRGADLEAYVAAHGDAALRTTLDRNFRSSDALVRSVSLLFGRADAFVTTAIALPAVQAAAAPDTLQLRGDGEAALRWRLLPVGGKPLNKDEAEDRIARDVAAEISKLLRGAASLDDRPLRPRDIAVLTRTNRQAVAVQDELRAAGIVAAIGKAGDIWKTDELVEVERFVLAVLQPGDPSKARAAMATRLWGKTAAQIAAFDGDDSGFDGELERLEQWRRLWLRRGFVVMKEQMLRELGVEARLLAHRGGERRLTNFQQLFELLHAAEHEHRLSPEGVLEWLQHERVHQDEIDYQVRELRLESDDDAVQILTVHGSKGLQYEVVFCPFLWDARAPGGATVVRGAAGRELAFAMTKTHQPELWLAADELRLAEDVRLCYVALTRSVRRCYVHWAPASSSSRSALAWILTPPSPPRTTARWLDAWADGVKKDPTCIERNLRAFAGASDGAMDVTAVPAAPIAAPVPPLPAAELSPPRAPVRTVRARGLHSFSSIVAEAAPAEDSRDVRDEPARPAARPDAAPPDGIFAFARGAAAGTCLHDILEHTDFGRIDDALALRVREELAAAGLLEPASHAGEIDPPATVLQNLRDLAAARAWPAGPTLQALCAARAAEWQFVLPTAHSDVGSLAALFEASDSSAARDQARRLRQLPGRTLRGFLTGFVDLVCEHEGRHYVIDWKSNHLGNRLEDYGDGALRAAMRDHDYVLQYHLYVLALHRHLRARLRDYDYDRCVGGVCYVFLRGATPGSANGMYFDRVPRSLVEGMDRWAGLDHGDP